MKGSIVLVKQGNYHNLQNYNRSFFNKLTEIIEERSASILMKLFTDPF